MCVFLTSLNLLIITSIILFEKIRHIRIFRSYYDKNAKKYLKFNEKKLL